MPLQGLPRRRLNLQAPAPPGEATRPRSDEAAVEAASYPWISAYIHAGSSETLTASFTLAGGTVLVVRGRPDLAGKHRRARGILTVIEATASPVRPSRRLSGVIARSLLYALAAEACYGVPKRRLEALTERSECKRQP